MNVFAKLSTVKRILEPVCTPESMPDLVTQSAKWHYDKKRHLTPEALKVYEILINNSYNPYTVYRWFLLEKSLLEESPSSHKLNIFLLFFLNSTLS